LIGERKTAPPANRQKGKHEDRKAREKIGAMEEAENDAQDYLLFI